MSDSEVEFEYEYYDADQGETSSQLSNGTSVHDPEFVVYTCYKPAEVSRILNNEVKRVANEFFISEDEAWQMCLNSKWNLDDLAENFTTKKDEYFVKCSLKSPSKVSHRERNGNSLDFFCQVCYRNVTNMMKLQCEHTFCSECWVSYFTNLLQEGVSSRIECMNPECSVVCLRSFIRDLLADKPLLLQQYEKRVLADAVLTHPYFTFCPGNDCDGIVYCETKKAHRVTCKFCNHSFCVRCGFEYHAPSSCDIMAKWRKKCGDDSETANYISAHTKDCPNCHSCIEKNGGCNHMQCAKCKHHFCWMCFKDWKTHGSEYYECSRYKENPAIAQEANYLKARRALEKYLHYYERFDNHSKSLKLEEELRARIVKRIEEKVANRQGTWIDWQYLHDAATLLTKCRYTLQYTYPFAYYLESGQRQELFEYQQAQLEKEIEELSWKVERAETTDRADLEKQMHVAECKRQTLLQDFLS